MAYTYVCSVRTNIEIMAGLIEKASSLAGALGPIGMGVSVAGQIFGAIKGAKERKKQQELLSQQQAENKAMYDKNVNQSFLDTNVAKDAVKQANESLVDNRKAVAGRAAVTGASDEAVVAGNASVNKTYNDSISRLAGMGTQYQQGQEDRYRANKARLDQNQSNVYAQGAENAANLVSNAGELMGTVAMAAGMDSPAGKDSVRHMGDPGTVAASGNFSKMAPVGSPVTTGLGIKLDNDLKK